MASKATVDTPSPSRWWRRWMLLKGTDSTTYTLPDVDLRGKWALVTGGNNGIGFESALQFAAWGANIVLACRLNSPPHERQPDAAVQECRAKADAAGHKDTIIEWWPVDMTDLATVKALGDKYVTSGRPLDIFANNAGISAIGQKEPPPTKDGYGLIHQVNFLSHVLLAHVLLPSLAKAKAPRMTCTTSCMQYAGIFDISNANEAENAYANNKLYYQVWLTEYSLRLKQYDQYKHITVHGVHPGFVKTGIWVNQSNGAMPKASQAPGLVGKLLLGGLNNYSVTPQQGSLTIINAATHPDYAVNSQGYGGAGYFNRITPETPMPYVEDPKARAIVWNFVNEELSKQIKITL